MPVDYTKLNFYTGANYMKRSGKSGQSTISTIDLLVNHNLGFIAQFLTYVDLDNNGILWYGGERVFAGTDSTAASWTYPPIVNAWTDINTLTLHPSNIPTARACYWLLYLDYKGL